MNKEIIIFGSFLSVFLMLMIPIIPAVENQNQKNIINSHIKSLDYTSFVKIVKQMSKDELREVYKNIFKNLPEEPEICHLLFILFVITLVNTILIIPSLYPEWNIFHLILAFIIFLYAKKIECEWTQQPILSFLPNTETPYSSCALEKLVQRFSFLNKKLNQTI